MASIQIPVKEKATLNIQINSEEDCKKKKRKQAPCKFSRLQFKTQLFDVKNHTTEEDRNEPHKLSSLKFILFQLWLSSLLLLSDKRCDILLLCFFFKNKLIHDG